MYIKFMSDFIKGHWGNWRVPDPGDQIKIIIPGFYYGTNTPCEIGSGEYFDSEWKTGNIPWKSGDVVVVEKVDLREKENDPRAQPAHVWWWVYAIHNNKQWRFKHFYIDSVIEKEK